MSNIFDRDNMYSREAFTPDKLAEKVRDLDREVNRRVIKINGEEPDEDGNIITDYLARVEVVDALEDRLDTTRQELDTKIDQTKEAIEEDVNSGFDSVWQELAIKADETKVEEELEKKPGYGEVRLNNELIDEQALTPALIEKIEDTEGLAKEEDLDALGDDLSLVRQDLTQVEEQKADVLRENVTYKIPSDYPSMQSAVDALSEVAVSNGAIIDLVLESGYEIEAGLHVENGDYSHFQISSEDNIVTLADNFIPAPGGLEGINLEDSGYVIVGDNARMPVLNCVIDAVNSDTGLIGYSAINSSTGYVKPDCGVLNAAYAGIESRSSLVSAEESTVNGCFIGVNALRGGTVNFKGGKANDTHEGVRSSGGARVDATGAETLEAEYAGVHALEGGLVVFIDGEASSLEVSQGGTIYANGSTGSTQPEELNSISSAGIIFKEQ